MIPGGGCGRLAQLTKIEAEIHAVSQVLQVARVLPFSFKASFVDWCKAFAKPRGLALRIHLTVDSPLARLGADRLQPSGCLKLPWEEVLEEFGACWEGLEDPRTRNAALHDPRSFDDCSMYGAVRDPSRRSATTRAATASPRPCQAPRLGFGCRKRLAITVTTRIIPVVTALDSNRGAPPNVDGLGLGFGREQGGASRMITKRPP
jgi:hypothetical protein